MHFTSDWAGAPDDWADVPDTLLSAVSARGLLAAAADELLVAEDALPAPSLLHAVSARPRATAVMVITEIFRVRMLVSVLCVGAVAPGKRASG